MANGKLGRGRPPRVRFRKLRERMTALNVNGADLAELLGVESSTISRKLSGKSPWYLDEIHMILEYLQISQGEMYLYFPRYGEDAENIQHHYVREYLEDTNQSLISTSTLETLIACVESINAHTTGTERQHAM